MINEKYSFKDFTGMDLSRHDPAGFTGIIKGSCFAQEFLFNEEPVPRSIFPVGIYCIFERCNLDNVLVTQVMTDDCSNRVIKVQNDREDWVLDGQGKPLEPVNKRMFIKAGIPLEPRHIPSRLQSDNITFIARSQMGAR